MVGWQHEEPRSEKPGPEEPGPEDPDLRSLDLRSPVSRAAVQRWTVKGVWWGLTLSFCPVPASMICCLGWGCRALGAGQIFQALTFRAGPGSQPLPDSCWGN